MLDLHSSRRCPFSLWLPHLKQNSLQAATSSLDRMSHPYLPEQEKTGTKGVGYVFGCSLLVPNWPLACLISRPSQNCSF